MVFVVSLSSLILAVAPLATAQEPSAAVVQEGAGRRALRGAAHAGGARLGESGLFGPGGDGLAPQTAWTRDTWAEGSTQYGGSQAGCDLRAVRASAPRHGPRARDQVK